MHPFGKICSYLLQRRALGGFRCLNIIGKNRGAFAGVQAFALGGFGLLLIVKNRIIFAIALAFATPNHLARRAFLKLHINHHPDNILTGHIIFVIGLGILFEAAHRAVQNHISLGRAGYLQLAAFDKLIYEGIGENPFRFGLEGFVFEVRYGNGFHICQKRIVKPRPVIAAAGACQAHNADKKENAEFFHVTPLLQLLKNYGSMIISVVY